MTQSSVLRIAPGADGVSIWSSRLFGPDQTTSVHEFLSRAFAVQEVESVQLDRASSFGRISYAAVANPGRILKKLSRALGLADAANTKTKRQEHLTTRLDATSLFLDAPGTAPVRVSRVGAALSTWRVRELGESSLRLWHPRLRNRRDVAFRLEEELAALLGVERFSTNTLTGAVAIYFDKGALPVEHLAGELERAWPRLLEGLEAPPSQQKLAVAGGLLGLAVTGQFFVPGLRPIALAAAALYSAPNLVNGAKELARGQVGLPALYSTGLAFMLLSGMPFGSTLSAVFFQFWPHLARRKVVHSQRRLFAAQRRRPVWARVAQADGTEVQLSVSGLDKDARIVVRKGELVPVDGVVESGSAVVAAAALHDTDQVEDRLPGDSICAGTFVRHGSLTIRVERVGASTSASFVDSLLPHSPIKVSAATLEAERVANRNAKPALALSAASFFFTRVLQPSQTVIRPDYSTAPRLSAQLSTLHGLAQGLQAGVLLRNPSALDHLSSADVYVFDDSAGIAQRSAQVAGVRAAAKIDEELVLGYAKAAYDEARNEQSFALFSLTSGVKVIAPETNSVRRLAGVTRYRDPVGNVIEIATPAYLAASNIDVPQRLQAALSQPPPASSRRVGADIQEDQPPPRPLWVLRNGEVLGAVSFQRTGEPVGKQLLEALRAHNKRARIVYVSRGGHAKAQALARAIGLEFAYGGLGRAAKAELIRGLGRKTLWIGDGTAPTAGEPIGASTVSVSVAPLWRASSDAADILLPWNGLAGLPAVLELGRAHERRLARDYRSVYALNLLGVAGAYLAQFTSLQAGLLSNLGTWFVYARQARGLDELVFAAEDARARLARSAFV